MIPLALSSVAALLHLATAWRYGYFRDELYFIASSKHLAWGYVDQPPMVAVAAWLAAPTGYGLIALRALPILASVLTVYLAAQLARELGGGRFAQVLAGVATLLTPAYLLLGNTLTTTSFEPFFWTLAIYCCVRIVRARGSRPTAWWFALGLAAVFGMYSKYSMLLPIAGLLAGLLATPQRRVLGSPYALYAFVAAAVLLAPNIVWQSSRDWPIVEVLRGDVAHRHTFANGLALESLNVVRNAFDFVLEQLLYTNPVAAPVWIAGLVAPYRVAALRDLRFVTIAYVFILLAAVALSAKGYYIV
ncbi:MAG: glycosyltransferase family 39 protein, partial [Candidatus Cybelea sp.]